MCTSCPRLIVSCYVVRKLTFAAERSHLACSAVFTQARQICVLALFRSVHTMSKDLHKAAEKGDIKAMETALSAAGNNAGEDGNLIDSEDGQACPHTPLMLAVSNGHVDASKYLIKHKATVDKAKSVRCC